MAGLSTTERARALLTTEVTMAQRIVRSKRTLSEAKVPLEVPTGDELRARIPPTLEVVYLIFNEGYAATAGEDWLRPDLCAASIAQPWRRTWFGSTLSSRRRPAMQKHLPP